MSSRRLKMKNKNIILAVTGLVAAAAPVQVTPSVKLDTAAQINTASLRSMEQSYLSVPRICKAGTAAFAPQLETEMLSAKVQAIHALL